MIEEQDFAESKGAAKESNQGSQSSAAGQPTEDADGFMNIPDGIDEELPFS